MSQVADAIVANLFVKLGIPNNTHGNSWPVLYVQLFDTISFEDDDDYYPPGTKRDTHDDIKAFEKVWMEIRQDERLLTDLKTFEDEHGRTVFAKAVEYDCVKITRMLISENFGDRDVAYIYSYSQDCSYAMHTLLLETGLLNYDQDTNKHDHKG